MRNILIVLALSVLSLSALGQTSRGTVTGTVTDATGAVISGASVTLTNTGTNLTRSTITNKEGFYRFDAIDLGDYKVKISAQGFADITKTNIIVTANQTANINSQLSIGTQELVVDVTSESGASLQTETVVRGGNIDSKRIMELPFQSLNPTQLALTLPGVSTNRFGFGDSTYSINGSRGRSNNFLIDGTENNDISVAGQGFKIKIPDAVSEVSVQTSNFDAEFGRAGGGVFNTITKSGTNNYHGSASWRYDSTRDDAITNTQSLSKAIRDRGYPPYGTEHTFSGTLGGHIVKDRTFFFVGFMNQRTATNTTKLVYVPSEEGRATLRNLFGTGNERVNYYLAATEGSTAASNFSNVVLGNGRPDVQFGLASNTFSRTVTQPQLISKVDHKISEKSQLSGRFMFDQSDEPLGGATLGLNGFTTSSKGRNLNALISETHIFSPTVTNELRISYNRLSYSWPFDPSSDLAKNLYNVTIAGINNASSTGYNIGIDTALPQGRTANNYIIQDTLTKVIGTHTFRVGLDLLQQRSRQAAPFNSRGSFIYRASDNHSGFANFIDDFSGSKGSVSRDFGDALYYPELFRQAYFFQDRWKVKSSFTLTLGIRYENFGEPMNVIKTPAFAGLFLADPMTFTLPNKVKRDNNNFSPTVGIAYTPSFENGLLKSIFGEQKSVIRAGYQIGYDAYFNNITSNAIASSPNNTSNNITSTLPGRGIENLSSYYPTTRRAPRPLDNATLMDKNLVNPYTQRWSLGIQRELPSQFMLDVSYVGSKGTKLFMNEDRNPFVPANLQVRPTGATTCDSGRLDCTQGGRTIRSNSGSSSYHAAQTQLTRRFTNNFTVTGAYTWSKMIDNGSEVFAFGSGLSNSSLAVLPHILGGERLERAVSQFDRTHRASFTYVYTLPFMIDQKGVLGHIVGGWQVSGITSFESGVPYSILNGLDSNGIGSNNERPDYNPAGQEGVRAKWNKNPDTGIVYYTNPETGAVIDPSTARYIQLPAGIGRNGTLGRNTERTKGINNFDFTAQKDFKITEGINLQFRTELFNVFNHPQFGSASVSPFSPTTAAPQANVGDTVKGFFLQPQYGDGGGRVIRYYLKLSF